jgi:conjugal transfer pilus assembly protein TrbC
MTICAPSRPDRRQRLSPVLLLALASTMTVSPASATEPVDAGPPTQVDLGPTALPVPSEAMRRRAFDALGRRGRFPEIEARAKADKNAAAERMAAEHEAMQARLYQALGLALPDDPAAPKPTPTAASKAWVPLIFASSSMPIPTLRTYAAQLEKAGGVIAFRGVPGGLSRIGPMARLSARILRLDPGCEGPACAMRNVQLVVDPILFRQHGVTRVPAFAMVPVDPTLPYCERDEEIVPRASHIVYGDAALSGLIEEYARLGGKEEVSYAASRLSRR